MHSSLWAFMCEKGNSSPHPTHFWGGPISSLLQPGRLSYKQDHFKIQQMQWLSMWRWRCDCHSQSAFLKWNTSWKVRNLRGPDLGSFGVVVWKEWHDQSGLGDLSNVLHDNPHWDRGWGSGGDCVLFQRFWATQIHPLVWVLDRLHTEIL